MEPSSLALFWAAVVAAAILIYVILDGFDLGIGILFGTTRNTALKEQMIETIAPFWDGNETWLVVIGASLFAAFPAVYGVFLAAFYIPVLLLLLGLIFRGVAFEFRIRGRAGGLWDMGFFLGSAVAAFVQGAAVGAMILGLPVDGNQYAGRSFDWVAPLPVVSGFGLMLGYMLLGAGWLVLKTDGKLYDWAWRRIPWLACGMLLAVTLAFFAALLHREALAGALPHGRIWGIAFPCIGLAAIWGVLVSVPLRRRVWPFLSTILFFLAAFFTLAVIFWPYMIPYAITVVSAAAPEASLRFMFWGAGVFVLPVILLYTGAVYWLFRGRLPPV